MTVRDGDLHVDIWAPAGDFERLMFHLRKLIGEKSTRWSAMCDTSDLRGGMRSATDADVEPQSFSRLNGAI